MYEYELPNVGAACSFGCLWDTEGVEVETQSGNSESWGRHRRALPWAHRVPRRSGSALPPCGGNPEERQQAGARAQWGDFDRQRGDRRVGPAADLGTRETSGVEVCGCEFDRTGIARSDEPGLGAGRASDSGL